MWRFLTILTLLATLLAPAGCGGSSGSDSSASSIERRVAELEAREAEEVGVIGEILFEAHWTKTYSFTENSATKTRAGKLKVGFTNPQKMPQNIAFEDSTGSVIGKTKPLVEGSTSVVADFKPGVYHYFSTLKGHREKGMEGTLVVSK